MRAPLPVIALSSLLLMAGCVVVDDTRPGSAAGVTGAADPAGYLKPIAKPTPATRDPGLVPGGSAGGAGVVPPGGLAPPPTPVPVDADPAAPTGEELEEGGEEPADDGDFSPEEGEASPDGAEPLPEDGI